jgi:hypothetical protein
MALRIALVLAVALYFQVGRTVLDVKLRPGSERLLIEVEKLYGRPLAVERIVPPGGGWGSSRVDPDGTPRIRIAPEAAGDEAIIVHELLHLKLRAQGAPVFLWKSRASEARLKSLADVQSQLYDAIQHRAFAGEMRALRLDSSGRFRDQLNSMIRNRRFDGAATDLGKAVVAARVFLEFGEGPELGALRAWYAQAGWQQSLVFGNRAIMALTPFVTEPKAQAAQFIAAQRALGIDVIIEGYAEVMLGKHRVVQALALYRGK